MTNDTKPVAWAIFRDGELDWEHDQPFSDEPQSMMDDEESRPLYGGEVIAEIKRLREALERLARLGNGRLYGNSEGNMIARVALENTNAR